MNAAEAVLLDLLAQVRKFCAEQGEADFETGAAEAMRRQIVGQELTPGLRGQLDKVLAAHSAALPAATLPPNLSPRMQTALFHGLGISGTECIARYRDMLAAIPTSAWAPTRGGADG